MWAHARGPKRHPSPSTARHVSFAGRVSRSFQHHSSLQYCHCAFAWHGGDESALPLAGEEQCRDMEPRAEGGGGCRAGQGHGVTHRQHSLTPRCTPCIPHPKGSGEPHEHGSLLVTVRGQHSLRCHPAAGVCRGDAGRLQHPHSPTSVPPPPPALPPRCCLPTRGRGGRKHPPAARISRPRAFPRRAGCLRWAPGS